ncbi:MAG: multiple sugar transport system permease protein [Granulosicoccus sp.]|jgi:multiple sugar transport system permease protein
MPKFMNEHRRWLFISLSPLIFFLVVFTLLPLINVFYMSFFDVVWKDTKYTYTFAGFENYAALPSDKFFVPGLKNTFVFSIVGVSIQMVLGFLIALFVTKIKRGKTFFISVFLIPVLLPPIVIGSVWRLLYGYDFGIINYLLGFLGIMPLDWLGSHSLAFTSIVIVDVWHWTPFIFLLLLAGLESIPEDVYEAGRVDGVSAFQELLYITLPLMIPTLLVTMIFRMITSFKVFDEIYLLTSGGPGTSTEVISFSIYKTFFQSDNLGLGSAMSVVALLLVTFLTILALAAFRNRQADE